MNYELEKYKEFLESQQDEKAPLTKPKKIKIKVVEEIEPSIEPPI